jgi:hypothetical protein
MLSGSLGSCHRTSEPAGVSHLWTATQEQRDWRRSSREASSASTSHMGSASTNKVARTQLDGQRVVDDDRMERVQVGLRDCF